MADVVIGIGRGRPSDANYLNSTEWLLFQSELLTIVRENAVSLNAQNDGMTFSEGWGDEQGLWVAATFREDQITYLRGSLAQLARRYRQDAIALTVGATEMIEG